MTTAYPLGSREDVLRKPFALDGAELADTIPARSKLVEKLLAACRRERERGLAGDWTYDIARHNGMIALFRSEKAALDAMVAAALPLAA